jgi:ribosomal protein S18 acetylase RimI-like enzyme
MSGAPGPFIFFQIPSTLAKQAFAFHQSISSSNEHIWPRTQEQVEQFSKDGELFGVRRASTGEFVGLCYATLDGNEWELGGLTVEESTRRSGLGEALVRFALACTIAYQRPWAYAQELVAHVHEANDKPRNLLKRVGFEHVGKVELPGDKAPASMKRNAEGKVVGDIFRFPRNGVAELSSWFAKDFKGTLADGTTEAIFEVRPGGLDSIIEALREAAEDLRQKG